MVIIELKYADINVFLRMAIFWVTAFKNAPKWHISKFKSESRPIYAWEKQISGLKQAKIKKSVANSNLNGP